MDNTTQNIIILLWIFLLQSWTKYKGCITWKESVQNANKFSRPVFAICYYNKKSDHGNLEKPNTEGLNYSQYLTSHHLPECIQSIQHKLQFPNHTTGCILELSECIYALSLFFQTPQPYINFLYKCRTSSATWPPAKNSERA